MVLAACGIVTIPVVGQERGEWIPATPLPDGRPSPDKSGYNLFNPTPRDMMREMSTDRPDTTESPYTVDAGHFQFELSLLDYAYNDDRGVQTDALSILPSNIKVGLLNNVDIQFVFTPYIRQGLDSDEGSDDTVDDFIDDTQVRLKINLWGNDGPKPGFGDTAFAIMPFIGFPTGSSDLSNDHVEGGIILPLAIALPGEFGLGLMPEVDFVYNEASGGYGVDFVHTATIGHDIPGIDNLAGYVEYIGIAPHDTGGTYQAFASGGLTYALTDDWVVDFGGTVGISNSADDFTVFVGTSFRF
ncbi:MAG: transporter [Tepidisphaeraceae bacterium]